MTTDERYMHRCLQLAALGAGHVAPNPMVGAVLVYNDQIIGEGYHQQYGQAHAEVNCIASVAGHHRHLIKESTIYVSLEPCAHFGKTPPCADLIIQQQIPRVVIGCTDSFAQVNGKGIQKLLAAGVQVSNGVLEPEARRLNRRFFSFHLQQRPYIILKWAQSNDAKIAKADYGSVAISNAICNRLVHRWRSEEAAIMVGTNTALFDNPSLTTRLWKGKHPVRILLDKQLKVPVTHQLLSDELPTLLFNLLQESTKGHLQYCQLREDAPMIPQLLTTLHGRGIQSVLVEGGTRLIQSFIDGGLWDECRVITNVQLHLGHGIAAPVLQNHQLLATETYLADRIQYFQPISQ